MFKWLRIPASETMVETVTQFIKFGVVGISNTLISYILNIVVLLLLKPLGLAWDYIIGNLVAFFLSVLWSFYWNNKYVFKTNATERSKVWKTLLRTYISYGVTGIVLSNVLSYVWIDVFSISKYIAPILNLLISVPVNFLLNKFWAFNNQ